MSGACDYLNKKKLHYNTDTKLINEYTCFEAVIYELSNIYTYWSA